MLQINPMLAKASAPFDSRDWLFEIKWDGERIIAFIGEGKIIRLQNRHLQDVSRKFPEVIGSPINAKDCILDGEMIVFGDDHKPSFSRLSQRAHLEDPLKIKLLSQAMPASYVAFDLIRYNGNMLNTLPLIKRKETLESLIPKEGSVIPTFTVEGNGTEFFKTIVNLSYEGIMAKKKDGYYYQGKRSDLWLKMKPRHSAICHVVGFTKGNGSRERLGALLIEEWDGKVFHERGRVGSGISDKALADLVSTLRPVCESRDGSIVFVEPATKIEVSYFEQTESGHFRFQSLEGGYNR